MHPALKILIGALMVVVGVYSTVTFWDQLLLVVKAGVGPLLVLIGAFVVWLESDELKMRRESQAQDFQRQLESAAQEDDDEEDEEDEEGFTCSDCGKTFDTERGLNIHRAQKHK